LGWLFRRLLLVGCLQLRQQLLLHCTHGRGRSRCCREAEQLVHLICHEQEAILVGQADQVTAAL
jgi:hypothetical protein